MTPYQSSTNPRLCSVDKHILVVVCRRRWWRLWDNVSCLRCLFCDLNLAGGGQDLPPAPSGRGPLW